MATFPMWAAIRTVKSKLGTWVGYDKYSEIDASITREEWADAIGSARAAIANKVDESTRPLNRRPVGSEITNYPTRKARGFLQQVTVFVRDVDTGIIEERPYYVKTETLRSRQVIVNEALSRFATSAAVDPEGYEGEIVGAIYDGTHHMVPRT